MAYYAGKHGAAPTRAPRAPSPACALFALALTFAIALQPWLAYAQPGDVVAAANAFQEAQRAEVSGDMARAAELYELADRISPTPEALRNATRSRLQAGQLVAAATHAEELLARYGDEHTSAELANEVLRRARPELGRVLVTCEGECTVVIDGLAGATQPSEHQVVYVKPGAHQLVARFADSESEPVAIDAQAGAESALRVAHPPPTAAPVASAPSAQPDETAASRQAKYTAQSQRGRSELHPAYFWSLAGATAALGAVTIWSGVDLLKAKDDFKSDPTPTRSEFNDGEKKDRRTTALIVTTGALAASTVVMAFFTDFKGERFAPSASVDKHGAAFTLKGRF
jgi:hypothetical protein